MALAIPRAARGAVLACLSISYLAGMSIGTAAAGDWTITPFISGQETFTDNVLLTPTKRQSDFVTGLSPGISITGESARFSANLNYSPTVQLFALTPNQNFIGHNLYANGNAILVKDLLFLDARGYLAVLPTNTGLTTSCFALPSAAPGVSSAVTGIPSAA